jgi:hypothetical protein
MNDKTVTCPLAVAGFITGNRVKPLPVLSPATTRILVNQK